MRHSSEQDNRNDSWTRSIRAGTDMTPMVDVTFLLLIFFMVTASFSLQRAIAMPQPRSQQSLSRAAQPPQRETISLSVDRFGGFHLVTNLGEQELLGKQSLISALKQAHRQQVDAQLVVSVDSQARLQWMVDAIDAGTIAEFQPITVQQSDDNA